MTNIFFFKRHIILFITFFIYLFLQKNLNNWLQKVIQMFSFFFLILIKKTKKNVVSIFKNVLIKKKKKIAKLYNLLWYNLLEYVLALKPWHEIPNPLVHMHYEQNHIWQPLNSVLPILWHETWLFLSSFLLALQTKIESSLIFESDSWSLH